MSLPARTTAHESDCPTSFSKRLRPGAHLIRAAVVEAICEHKGLDVQPDQVFKGDEVTSLLTKAATTPATLGNAGWAGNLAGQAVADFVVGMAPMSAAAALIERGMRVSLDGYASVQIPGKLMTAADAGGFVSEASPLQVRQLNIGTGPTITPSKLAVLTAYTREMADRSVTEFEIVVRQMLSEACSLALDAAMFSSAAAVAGLRPAGILAGQAPISARPGGGSAALAKDIENLISAIAAIGGGSSIMLFASPGKVASLKAWAGPNFNYSILSSSALAAGQVIAIDTDLFVSGFSPTPEFRSSIEATMHFEDVGPAHIGTVNPSPPPTVIVASPVRSLYQIDAIAIRMVLRCGWALRAQGAAQHIATVSW